MKNKNLKTEKNKKTGFTLVESLISISILMISIAAPLSLAGNGLVAASIAQKQIVAFYLAQDATERLINIKMANKLNSEQLLEGMSCTGNTLYTVGASNFTGCIVKTRYGSPIVGCYSDNCKTSGKLYIDNNGHYSHSSSNGSDSGFVRFSQIKQKSFLGVTTVEAEIQTTVLWKGVNGKPQIHKLNTLISNW